MVIGARGSPVTACARLGGAAAISSCRALVARRRAAVEIAVEGGQVQDDRAGAAREGPGQRAGEPRGSVGVQAPGECEDAEAVQKLVAPLEAHAGLLAVRGPGRAARKAQGAVSMPYRSA